MDNLGEARRRAFSMWLRTGRLPDWARTRNDEVKFNPWHDADDGRFTHAGTGRYFGRGSSRAAVARMHERPSEPGRREDRFGGFSPDEGPDPDPGFNMGGASGDYSPPDPSVHRGELAQGGRPETHGANLALEGHWITPSGAGNRTATCRKRCKRGEPAPGAAFSEASCSGVGASGRCRSLRRRQERNTAACHAVPLHLVGSASAAR